MIDIPKELDLCIYHEPCTDGFASAWSVWKKFGDKVQYMPLRLDREKNGMDDHWLSLVKNKRVVICDCSFDRDLLLKVKEATKYLLVLDHHKSNLKELGDLPFCYFDMKRSGAGITWDTFHPGEDRPTLINYVEDRDLWNNSLPYIEEISALAHSTPKTWKAYSKLSSELEKNFDAQALVGKAVYDARIEIAKMAAQHIEEWDINGHKIKSCNSTSMPSEVCTEMFHTVDEDILGCYWFGNGRMTWSLRVRGKDSKVNADEIAAEFEGGGGHRASAGFSVKIDKVDLIKRKVSR